MERQKTATATPAVIKSVLWSISATFGIIGSIQLLVFSGDSIPYFVVASVFGVLWALFAAITKHPAKDNHGPEALSDAS
ncbi:MAG: hypothetical protein QXU32_08755 [Nitrososphaerales archaeon]